jgi:hypothetical protein
VQRKFMLVVAAGDGADLRKVHAQQSSKAIETRNVLPKRV